jgi:hypothetical protein
MLPVQVAVAVLAVLFMQVPLLLLELHMELL